MNIYNNMKAVILIIIALPLILTSCKSEDSSGLESGNIKYAKNLSIQEYDDYTYVIIRNPWDTPSTLASYCLIDRNLSELPKNLPAGTTTIKTPITKSVIYSSVHASLIEELGCGDAVSGICDSQFIIDKSIIAGIKSGKIADCGNSMQPNVEKIISTGAEIVWLSPFESDNGSHGKLSLLGLPIVEGADYLENTPLARAEWMKFYGRLYGKGDKADSLFAKTEREYMEMKSKAEKVTTRPSVIFDKIYSGSWNVPTSGSVTGQMIVDAGGNNPFGDYNNAGSATLSPETVIFKGGDADIWFIRYYGDKELTMSDLSADNDAYSRFKAFKNSAVFGTNTQKSSVFDDAAFHPQWLLSDLISIIHPELGIVPMKHYYTKLK
jgi:iron complex transport system substrate-binding protein